MSLSMALYAKKITLISVLNNWVWITLMNFIGAIFVAYCFGHLGGLTEGEYLNKTVAIAEGKLHESFGRTLILAIGCNWLVCLALWLAYGTSDFVGKSSEFGFNYGICSDWISASSSKYVCHFRCYFCWSSNVDGFG